jgi:hypothetical protein
MVGFFLVSDNFLVRGERSLMLDLFHIYQHIVDVLAQNVEEDHFAIFLVLVDEVQFVFFLLRGIRKPSPKVPREIARNRHAQ